jgi:hypothetical protein
MSIDAHGEREQGDEEREDGHVLSGKYLWSWT